MAVEEFIEWQAYYQLEPFGDDVRNSQVAAVASTIANCNRNPRKQKQPFTLADFKVTIKTAKPSEMDEKNKELKMAHLFSFMKMAFKAKEVDS